MNQIDRVFAILLTQVIPFIKATGWFMTSLFALLNLLLDPQRFHQCFLFLLANYTELESGR